jgi:light-regulated signal transduction histidine kinase (bacteriophytochrome)
MSDLLSDERLVFAFAHDLRAYLRNIVTKVQLVKTSAIRILPDAEQSALTEAVAAATEINGLMNAMLSYCEGDPGSGNVGLNLLLRGLRIELKAALAEAGAELEIRNDLDEPVPAGLKDVLKELLTNACRFRSEAHPLRIIVATNRVSTGIEVIVSDNGIGVEPEFLEKIFAPFQRLHSRDRFPGFGLGLATCRRIVTAWEGSIAAEAGLDPGDGLTIRITLPSN